MVTHARTPGMTSAQYETEIEFHDNSPREDWYYALGLAGEAGEAVDAIKKGYRHAGMIRAVPLDPEKLAYELGDVLWYLTRLANRHGYTLYDIMYLNVKKLEKRREEAEMTKTAAPLPTEGPTNAGTDAGRINKW